MAKLTANQIALLRLGAIDPDGIIDRSQIEDKPAAALSAALGALRRKGLAAKTEGGRWQLTDAGLHAAGPAEAATATETAKLPAPRRAGKATSSPNNPGTHQQTRRGQLLTLLQRKAGASMAEMTDATGWQPHSVRALLSGLRKSGMRVDCARQKAGPSRYRVDAAAKVSR